MTSHDLIEYLKTHDLLAIHRIEQKIGMPQSTIGQCLGDNPRAIPKKWIEPLANELKTYGLKINKK